VAGKLMVKETLKNAKLQLVKNKRIILISGAVVLIIILAVYIAGARQKSQTTDRTVQLTSHTVTRGDLIISVTESGDIKAIDSTDIKSEVEGRTSIISIVDEGTVITEEDVKNGMVLAELDSSQIRESLAQQEVTFSNAQADYEEAKESLEIRIKQNESDIKSGEMNERFALMDFKKYLGETLANSVFDEGAAAPESIDYQALLADDRLSGEALQELKGLSNDISLTESELNRAKKRLEGTERLFEKEYVAEMELIADRLDVQSLEARHEKAIIALELFKLYGFPKRTQELLANYHEATRELDRTEAGARSRLAQEQAKLRNKEATFNLQNERLEKYQAQYKACIIKAPVPGQVVYGSSMLDRHQRSRELIEVGAEVRERQRIISIPDTSQMKVEIKVHETWIGKVQPGQAARISVSAFPDETFNGIVLRKAPLAAPQNWRSPDLKVYATDVAIEGNHDFIKTGMSARVEVIIDRLQNVLTVPIQAVVAFEGKKYCYLYRSGGPVRQQVETGQFNANFVEIKTGLTEGDSVLLNPPRVKQIRQERRTIEPGEGDEPQDSDRVRQRPKGGDSERPRRQRPQ
jgi:HlyD family secretion protein